MYSFPYISYMILISLSLGLSYGLTKIMLKEYQCVVIHHLLNNRSAISFSSYLSRVIFTKKTDSKWLRHSREARKYLSCHINIQITYERNVFFFWCKTIRIQMVNSCWSDFYSNPDYFERGRIYHKIFNLHSSHTQLYIGSFYCFSE